MTTNKEKLEKIDKLLDVGFAKASPLREAFHVLLEDEPDTLVAGSRWKQVSTGAVYVLESNSSHQFRLRRQDTPNDFYEAYYDGWMHPAFMGSLLSSGNLVPYVEESPPADIEFDVGAIYQCTDKDYPMCFVLVRQPDCRFKLYSLSDGREWGTAASMSEMQEVLNSQFKYVGKYKL